MKQLVKRIHTIRNNTFVYIDIQILDVETVFPIIIKTHENTGNKFLHIPGIFLEAAKALSTWPEALGRFHGNQIDHCTLLSTCTGPSGPMRGLGAVSELCDWLTGTAPALSPDQLRHIGPVVTTTQ